MTDEEIERIKAHNPGIVVLDARDLRIDNVTWCQNIPVAAKVLPWYVRLWRRITGWQNSN